MNHEQVTKVKVLSALNIQTISTNTTTNGNIIDTRGFDSILFAFQTGTVTDGDYLPLIQEDDDAAMGSASAVADGDLRFINSSGAMVATGQEAAAGFTADTDDNKVSKIAYVGTKRYVRFNIVSTNASSGAVLGALAVLSDANIAGVASNQ